MHLMKLKKDGKVVGYLRITPSPSAWQGIWYQSIDEIGGFSQGRWYECPKGLIFDEACPYVCNDKNGDKVFAGDKIKRVPYDGDPNPKPYQTEGRKGTIAWHHGFLQWCFLNDRTHCLDDLVDSEIFEAGIELIKDKSEAE